MKKVLANFKTIYWKLSKLAYFQNKSFWEQKKKNKLSLGACTTIIVKNINKNIQYFQLKFWKNIFLKQFIK